MTMKAPSSATNAAGAPPLLETTTAVLGSAANGQKLSACCNATSLALRSRSELGVDQAIEVLFGLGR
jgi:hypothetical protein